MVNGLTWSLCSKLVNHCSKPNTFSLEIMLIENFEISFTHYLMHKNENFPDLLSGQPLSRTCRLGLFCSSFKRSFFRNFQLYWEAVFLVKLYFIFMLLNQITLTEFFYFGEITRAETWQSISLSKKNVRLNMTMKYMKNLWNLLIVCRLVKVKR